QASGCEKRRADIAGEQGVAATAVGLGDAIGLDERVDGEAACAVEPALVGGACERLQEPEAVARGAVAKAVALLVPVGACPPDQLGAREQEVLVEVVPGAGEDAGSARAPLETGDLPAWRPRPVGQAVLADRVATEDSSGLGAERVLGLETPQGQRVARSAVE